MKEDHYKAHARNKLIAEAFYLTGDIEKYGSGFLRIRKEISTYPTMKLGFREAPNGFLNKLSYRDQKIVTKQVDEGLNGGLKSLFEIIARYPGMQAKDLPHFLENRPLKTVEKQIKQLVDKELIERYGSRKTGGYFVVDRNLAE